MIVCDNVERIQYPPIDKRYPVGTTALEVPPTKALFRTRVPRKGGCLPKNKGEKQMKTLIALLLATIIIFSSIGVFAAENTNLNHLAGNISITMIDQLEYGTLKITSLEQLTNFLANINSEHWASESIIPWDELGSMYDEPFFENSFLLFADWGFSGGGINYFNISSISDDGDIINIEVKQGGIPHNWAIMSATLVFELDRMLLYRDFIITIIDTAFPDSQWQGTIPVLSSVTDEITVYLNDERLTFAAPPIIVDNHTLVPFRAIFEALGMGVMWRDGEDEMEWAFYYAGMFVGEYSHFRSPGQEFTLNYEIFDWVSYRPVIDTYGRMTILLQIGSSAMLVKNYPRWVELDVPPQIIDNHTFIPLRAIAESAGANVEWDAETKKITITTPSS